MRCKTAQERIALEPSGELSPAETRAVADHVEQCASCRRLAEAPPLSLAALRTPAPLRDADYAAVRARVLAAMEPGRRPLRFTPWLRLAAAAALVAAIAGMGVFLSMRERAAMPMPPALAEAPRSPAADVERSLAIADATVPPATAPEPEPAIPAAAPAPPAPPEAEASLAALEKPEELRIQIQTSDPEVRIIWIVNPTLEFEPTFLEEES